MNFERYCGMATASVLLLTVVLTILKPSEGVSTILTVVGVAAAVGGAYLAWSKSQEQIEIANKQLQLQQIQIDEAQRSARQAQFRALNGQVESLAADIDRLMLAASYLRLFADAFPKERMKEFQHCQTLLRAREQGLDVTSISATRAPFGFGESISTVMGRIQLVGDRMTREIMQGEYNPTVIFKRYEGTLTDAVQGIRSLANQIEKDVPLRKSQLERLADERDMYSSHAATH